MARPSKSEEVDLSQSCRLTPGAIERLRCPAGKAQAFLRDKKGNGLRVRVTANGVKSFVFEQKLGRQTIRKTIGKVSLWPDLEQGILFAQAEAARLAMQVNGAMDPREVARQEQADKEAAQVAAEAAARVRALTVADAWAQYLEQGKPKRRDGWKPRYLADMRMMAAPGGVPKKRGAGLTRPGPLYPLMNKPLASIDGDALADWFAKEAKAGRHQAARALMMFRGFMRWCTGRKEFRELVKADAHVSVLEQLPNVKRRTDALESAQVPAWWTAVEQLANRTASVYLRVLLLTGARREELASLTWKNVDTRWHKLTIADKVEDTRTIPLTPYVAQLLSQLPRTSEFVFAGAGKLGRIADVRASHAKALSEAGIEALTIHGLRRSFSLLGEAAGAPAGAIAQVMGHRPSAVAEGYRPRSIDALRPYLAQVEAHVLHVAGVTFDPKAKPGQLRVVQRQA